MRKLATFLATAALFGAPAAAQSIGFDRVTAGIEYQRSPSDTEALVETFRQGGHLDGLSSALAMPLLARGAPGIVVFDHDGDRDEDIYVTNNGANSLFSNQFAQTGEVSFVDVASATGTAAAAQDSTGACAGDIDNDGDLDLYVLGRMESNVFLRNLGGGQFADETAQAGLGAGALGHTSCSFGDIDNDGLLDVVIGNSFDWTSQEAIIEPFAYNHPNQLFRNLGGGTFEDVSARIGTHAGFPAGLENAPGLTWGIGFTDYDQDGDADILIADDQGLLPPAAGGGIDRGLLHIFENDGTGAFTDVTVQAGLTHPGDWTGLTVADYNCDGALDLFATNNGNWLPTFVGAPGPHDFNSRWYLGGPNGTFTDPGVGALGNTPFGWQPASADVDNDGDTDIVYVGGLDPNIFIDRSNPGTILRNDGCGAFSFDTALVSSHLRRSDQALALGDLNGDGFVDVVTVSNIDIPAPLPLLPWPFSFGSPFEAHNGFVPVWAPDGQGGFDFTGLRFPNGTLSVELSAGNENRWVKVEAVGSVGLTAHARVNRSAIGAVVRFTPKDGTTAIVPVGGGLGHASQDSRRLTFGLGRAPLGTLEVLWPGGIRNRLYHVRAGEDALFPEIPCDVSSGWPEYQACVAGSLHDIKTAGVINQTQLARLAASAIQFWHDEQP
jgi:enediyne biosynthesis protein E4